MMDFLANDQGEVEPFQLQIICQHIESRVQNRQKKGEIDIEVDDEILGGPKAMSELSQNFYRNSLRRLPFWRQRKRARRLCELGLLSPGGHRVSMEQGQIRKDYKVNEASLDKLTNARLIRMETRPGLKGFYYQLSHDSVADAVKKSRRLYLPKWFKVIIS